MLLQLPSRLMAWLLALVARRLWDFSRKVAFGSSGLSGFTGRRMGVLPAVCIHGVPRESGSGFLLSRPAGADASDGKTGHALNWSAVLFPFRLYDVATND